MTQIVSVATATPPHRVPQADARRLAGAHFAPHLSNIEKYLTVFDNSLVDERYFCVPPDWFFGTATLSDANRLYLEWAERLAADAASECLRRGNVEPADVDIVVFVSSTGIATPSLDVALIERLGLDSGVRRIPLFGLGCGGGAAGIALAHRLASEGTGHTVLLVAVELDSLTFQRDDFSKANLVAASLFSDGAAAVVVRGSPPAGSGGLEVLDSVTRLRPGSRDLMGWDFGDQGFKVVFSRRIPGIIREMMPRVLDELLTPHGVVPGDVPTLIVHPGGRKILESYEDLFDRDRDAFSSAYSVLSRYGNMSSATVLFVLAQAMEGNGGAPGDLGLLAAFGPGFSAEASLLRWT